MSGRLVEQHHWDAVAELSADGSVILLDVRTPGEVRKQGLLRSDALHIPLDELRGRLGELDKGRRFMSTATAACGAIWPAASCPSMASSVPTCPAAGASGPTTPPTGPTMPRRPTCAASPLERIKKFRLLSLESSRFYMLWLSSRRSRGSASRPPAR